MCSKKYHYILLSKIKKNGAHVCLNEMNVSPNSGNKDVLIAKIGKLKTSSFKRACLLATLEKFVLLVKNILSYCKVFKY